MKALLGFLSLTAVSSFASGAVLQGTVLNTGLPATAVLDPAGVVNWAAWNNTSNSNISTATASNLLSGGPTVGQPGYISSITSSGTVTNGSPLAHYVRGAGSATQLFSWTGRSAATVGYILDASLATAPAGEGVKFTVTGGTALAPGEFYRVSIWATGFEATGVLTATLANATTITLESQAYSTTKTPTLFTIDFLPDSATDLLGINYATKNSASGASSHVGIQAVSIIVVPEPATAALALSSGLLLLRRRRK